jgi:hypothetical protein
MSAPVTEDEINKLLSMVVRNNVFFIASIFRLSEVITGVILL